MANICTPTRVDHLDYNSGINVHTIARFVDDPDNDRAWITYASLASGTSIFRSGVYLREYDYVTKTLGDVIPIATDNSGTGRTSPTTRADNRGPMGLFKLSTGRFICVYSVSRDGTNGACVKESTDEGATWTDEVELLVPWSSSPVSWQYLDGHTDGTDVFLIGRCTGGSGGPAGYGTGDILLLRRTGIGTWMWSRIVNNENDSSVSISNYGQNPATIFWFESVGTDVWRMAFVGAYGLRSLAYQGMFCWENQAHTTTSEWIGTGSGDDSTNWNRRTIHDFTGEGTVESRRPVLRMGSDNILRLVYFDTIGDPAITYAYGATSVNWGQDWSDLSVLDLATVNSSTWNASYDASFSLDSQNRWILSTCHDDADFLTLYTKGFTTYLTDKDDNTGWNKYFKCDIQFDVTENKNGDGPGVSFWTENRHIRLLQSIKGGSYFRLLLLDGSVPVVEDLVCPPGTADYHVLYGTEVTICAEDVVVGHTYSWSGPNGYSSTERCITFVVTTATVGTYIVRITDTASGMFVDCPHVVTGYSNPPDTPPPPVIVPDYPLENRIFRRGVIKTQRAEIPQSGAVAVAEIERLD